MSTERENFNCIDSEYKTEEPSAYAIIMPDGELKPVFKQDIDS